MKPRRTDHANDTRTSTPMSGERHSPSVLDAVWSDRALEECARCPGLRTGAPGSDPCTQSAVKTVDERAKHIGQVLFADSGHLRSAIEQPSDRPLWLHDDLGPECVGDELPEAER